MIKRLTPVLVVASIERSLTFWVDQLGFDVTVRVPDSGGPLGFAVIVSDTCEIMLQSQSSINSDLPQIAGEEFRNAMFIEVKNLDYFQRKLEGAETVFERRTTFYGSTEIGLRDPDGHVLTLAEFKG